MERHPSLLRCTVQIRLEKMTSLTPRRLLLARTQLAMSQQSEELDVITSTARPEEWNEDESARTPP